MTWQRKNRRSVSDSIRKLADLVWDESERVVSVNIESHRPEREVASDGQYREFQPGQYTTHTVTLVVRNV